MSVHIGALGPEVPKQVPLSSKTATLPLAQRKHQVVFSREKTQFDDEDGTYLGSVQSGEYVLYPWKAKDSTQEFDVLLLLKEGDETGGVAFRVNDTDRCIRDGLELIMEDLRSESGDPSNVKVNRGSVVETQGNVWFEIIKYVTEHKILGPFVVGLVTVVVGTILAVTGSGAYAVIGITKLAAQTASAVIIILAITGGTILKNYADLRMKNYTTNQMLEHVGEDGRRMLLEDNLYDAQGRKTEKTLNFEQMITQNTRSISTTPSLQMRNTAIMERAEKVKSEVKTLIMKTRDISDSSRRQNSSKWNAGMEYLNKAFTHSNNALTFANNSNALNSAPGAVPMSSEAKKSVAASEQSLGSAKIALAPFIPIPISQNGGPLQGLNNLSPEQVNRYFPPVPRG